MKHLFLLLILVLCFYEAFSQRYISRNGHISFFSNTPLENIEANNHQAASILDAATGELVFNVLIKSFEFKIALMQEHFNENYMESDKFPKAGFKGKISDISAVNFEKDGVYNVDVEGELTIHGVSKSIKEKGRIIVKGKSLQAASDFTVQPADYNIRIPKIVEGKIARQVLVKLNLTDLPM
jgi:polyisoprenoid-binding protein YceI